LPEVTGGAALLIDPLDEDAIAAAMLRLIGDRQLRQHLSALSIAHASKLTWDKTAQQTWKVLEECCHA
jgi:glycosyltransferase involved in cell wall biosynthesis